MSDRQIKRVYEKEFQRRYFLMESQGREFKKGDLAQRIGNVLWCHWGAFSLAVAQTHPQWIEAPSPTSVELQAKLLEPWAGRLLDVGAVEALTRGDPMKFPTTMFTHGQELMHAYYVRSPGMLMTMLVETMPHGPGVAELAEDGLRFIGGTLHHWPWASLKCWTEEPDGALLVTTDPERGGGGYSIAVQPGNAKHRWVYLLPANGVDQDSPFN